MAAANVLEVVAGVVSTMVVVGGRCDGRRRQARQKWEVCRLGVAAQGVTRMGVVHAGHYALHQPK